MQALLPSVPALAVSVIYCLWNLSYRDRIRRELTLRARVAHMVWSAAAHVH